MVIALNTFSLLEESVPMYLKIYMDIKNKILSYQLLPNEHLASEEELGIFYNASRQTIRRAIQLLVDEKLIIKQQGKPSCIRSLLDASKAKTQVLKLGGINSADLLITKFHAIFAQKVSEMTDNHLTIEVEHSSTLGSGDEQVLKVYQGDQAMFGAAIEWLETIEAEWGISSIPFLFNNLTQLKKYVQSSFNDEMKLRLINTHGIRILADNWYRPSRVLASVKPCFTLQDLKGMRMAVSSTPLYRNLWQSLGVEPVDCKWGQESKAFLQKRVDCTDAPLDSLLQNNLHKVAPFLTQTNHLFSRACIIINEEIFQSLSHHFKEILILAAQETGKLFSTKIEENFQLEKDLILKDKASITYINTENFQKKIELVLKQDNLQTDFSYQLYKKIKRHF